MKIKDSGLTCWQLEWKWKKIKLRRLTSDSRLLSRIEFLLNLQTWQVQGGLETGDNLETTF